MHQAVERRKDQEKKFVDPKARWKAGLAEQRRRRTRLTAIVLTPLALLAMLGGAMMMGFRVGSPSALSDALSAPETTEVVRLDSQDLEEFPVELASVTALKSLYLDDNDLSTLPSALGEMKGLQLLSLSYNKLTALPNEIGHLAALEELQLKANSLTELPSGLCELHKLKKLDLTGNRLTELPADFGKLNSLRTLALRGNKISKLPAGLSKLSLLEELDLSGNPIDQLPSPESFPNLRKLNVKGTRVAPSQIQTYKTSLAKVSVVK